MQAIFICFIVTFVVLLIGFTNVDLSQYRFTEFFAISSDGLLYYTYLPALFIYHDINLNFLQNIVTQDFLTEFVCYGYIKYPIGVAYLQSPFFFVAHLITIYTNKYVANGYTAIYQVFIGLSALFYYLAGIILNYHILKKMFSNKVVQIVILLLTFGTGLLYYTTFEYSMSHVYSFFAISLFVWIVTKKNIFKINDKRYRRILNYFVLGLSLGLITAIRNINVFIFLIYIFYGVKNIKILKVRMIYFFKPINLISFIFGFLLLLIPQFMYWYNRTGHFIINSYKPEIYIEGYPITDKPIPYTDYFNFKNPHILEQLFSLRAGLFVYYPILLFSILGFSINKYKTNLKMGILIFFLLILYLLSSFNCWFAAASFGMRFYIDYLVLFGIMMGAFYQWVIDLNKQKVIIGVLIFSLVCIIATTIMQQLVVNGYCDTEGDIFNTDNSIIELIVNKALNKA
ncbi:hypothetical protein IJ182_10440 [bacterium]|nr:hypothetical protein [bacterium]